MPRPKKCRKICAMPKSAGFGPIDMIPGSGGSGRENCAARDECVRCGDISQERKFSEEKKISEEKKAAGSADIIEMTLDEYETIRLIDLQGFTQELCAQQMGVARTTVQAVYNEARRKLAQVLIEGKFLNIKGGNYIVCPKAEKCVSGRRGCCRESCNNDE